MSAGQGSLAERGAGFLYLLYLTDQEGNRPTRDVLSTTTRTGVANVEAELSPREWPGILVGLVVGHLPGRARIRRRERSLLPHRSTCGATWACSVPAGARTALGNSSFTESGGLLVFGGRVLRPDARRVGVHVRCGSVEKPGRGAERYTGGSEAQNHPDLMSLGRRAPLNLGDVRHVVAECAVDIASCGPFILFPSTGSMRCSTCGEPLQPGAVRCPTCGTSTPVGYGGRTSGGYPALPAVLLPGRGDSVFSARRTHRDARRRLASSRTASAVWCIGLLVASISFVPGVDSGGSTPRE